MGKDIKTDGQVEIPKVDFSKFDKMSARKRKAFAKEEIGKMLEDFGFIQIAGHGMPQDIVDRAAEMQRAFFALSEEEKLSVDGRDANNYERGFKPRHLFLAKKNELKETYHVGPELTETFNKVAIPENVWPEEKLVPGFQKAMLDLYAARNELANRVLRSLALYLDMDENFFVENSETGENILRLLYYPSFDGYEGEPNLTRAEAHPDLSAITLLPVEPGLQVQLKDGRWVDAVADKNAMVCNIGLVMEVLTNGALPATEHRVVVPEGTDLSKPRFTAPFFKHIDRDTPLRPLDTAVYRDGKKVSYPAAMTVADLVRMGHKKFKTVQDGTKMIIGLP